MSGPFVRHFATNERRPLNDGMNRLICKRVHREVLHAPGEIPGDSNSNFLSAPQNERSSLHTD